MAEVPSDVFDILHPSPVSLEELSAMAVSLEIWRREVNKYQKKYTSQKFKSHEREISSKTIVPNLPSAICDMIDEYIARLDCSVDVWLKAHDHWVFLFYSGDQKHILQVFDTFVCDYDGTIDYLKTAECMMQCDRLDMHTKFAVACTYFFEDDIRRIWPYVCEKIRLDDIYFYNSPQLYYWICCLRNELDRIPMRLQNSSVNEEMLDLCMPFNRPSVEYFWNRISLENQMWKAQYLCVAREKMFTRFILPKLDDQQVISFMNGEGGNSMLNDWLRNGDYDEETILRLWMRFRTTMNEKTFKQLVVRMLSSKAAEYRGYRARIYSIKKAIKYRRFKPNFGDKIQGTFIDILTKNFTYLCSEIWNAAPEYLKVLTIEDILFKSGLFNGTGPIYVPANAGFLITIIAYATFEDRIKFWYWAWPKLIERTRGEYLQRVVELCFKNNDDICQFKQDVLAKSDVLKNLCLAYLEENSFEDADDLLSWSFGNKEEICEFKQNILAKTEDVKNRCILYLRDNCFEDVNDVADFCCPKLQAARSFKQELLQSAFLSEQDTRLEFGVLPVIERFNEFIKNAYENANEGSDFKNQLILSPFCKPHLLKMVPTQCKQLMEFVNVFITDEQTLQEIKKDLIESVKSYFCDRKFDDCIPCVEYQDNFLLWCLGSEEEVSKFERENIFVTDELKIFDVCDSSDDDSDGCECITID